MSLPQKIDGSAISPQHLPDGRVYLDCPYPRIADIPRHFCNPKDAGLLEHLRCSKCGLLFPNEDGIVYVPYDPDTLSAVRAEQAREVKEYDSGGAETE